MSIKPIVPRSRANLDIDEAIDHYFAEGGLKTALNFIEALEAAYRLISRHPESGSPRYAHELDLPGLRFRPLKRYPYLVFYVEREDRVDLWRVLHEERDIPGWVREPEDH